MSCQALLYCDHLVPTGASDLAVAYAALYRRCILQQQSSVSIVVKDQFMRALTALTYPPPHDEHDVEPATTLKQLLTNVLAAEHSRFFFTQFTARSCFVCDGCNALGLPLSPRRHSSGTTLALQKFAMAMLHVMCGGPSRCVQTTESQQVLIEKQHVPTVCVLRCCMQATQSLSQRTLT